jgi:hypothetical protein
MLFGQIFLYYYIIKVLPHLTLYHLKDKKGSGALRRLTILKTMGEMFTKYRRCQSQPFFLCHGKSNLKTKLACICCLACHFPIRTKPTQDLHGDRPSHSLNFLFPTPRVLMLTVYGVMEGSVTKA